MKHPVPTEREFNTPAEMLSRATFLAMLAALSAGILLTVAGLITAEMRLALAGLGTLVLAGASRVWLHRRGELESVERSLEEIVERAPPVDETHGRQLFELLQEWEALEQKRGSADFDPWALQALRNDIRKLIEGDPALAQLFNELRRAA